VQAHTSTAAGDNAAGWQELAPQLNSQPIQVDLFSAGQNACLLAMLGSSTAVPAGTYQQIRLLLVPNSGWTGPVPTSNQCAGHGLNCVVLHDGSVHEIGLSSQANTGLKIPPGQVVGGPITVAPNETIDLNIDFNACGSIVRQGNGDYRLNPTLTAGQVRTNGTGISGQVVNAGSGQPIMGGTVLVALEQADSTGADVILQQAAADSAGNFVFCPLPTASTFDIVAVAIDGTGTAYGATVAVGVPSGTNLGAIPLTAVTGTATGPATLTGFVTATTGTAPANIDASLAAMQTVSIGGGATRPVTIPALEDSLSNIAVESSSTCPGGAPMNTNCAQYSLIEPAGNPRVGLFSSGGFSYSSPAGEDVRYTIRAEASQPMSGGVPICSPSTKTTDQNSGGTSLVVTPGASTTAARIDFTGCS
jgi:hypothetical protein